MIRDVEQALKVQQRRWAKGLFGLAGAVKRWNRRVTEAARASKGPETKRFVPGQVFGPSRVRAQRVELNKAEAT